MSLGRSINRLLAGTVGLQLVRVLPRDGDRYARYLLYEADEAFNRLYQEGMRRSGTPHMGPNRRERFYNLVQLFSYAMDTPGDVAECGCWNGLSSWLLCHYRRIKDPGYRGEDHHIFDSFEGLSAPGEADRIRDQALTASLGEYGGREGDFAAGVDRVKSVLADFPAVTYHPGWIPRSLESLSERAFRFVHLDLDLHEPTAGAVRYFFPRLAPGGMLVCDDYGSLRWPGAKRALDEYCGEAGIPILALSTGQAILRRR